MGENEVQYDVLEIVEDVRTASLDVLLEGLEVYVSTEKNCVVLNLDDSEDLRKEKIWFATGEASVADSVAQPVTFFKERPSGIEIDFMIYDRSWTGAEDKTKQYTLARYRALGSEEVDMQQPEA